MMGLYFYEVVDRMGRSGSGQMAADDEMIVAEKLRDMGLTVLDINKVRQSSLSTLFKRKPKVGIGDLALFSRQLQTLLEAGIPLTRGLYTLSNQVANRGFSEVLGEIAQHVDTGMSFSDSLSNYPEIFPSLFVNMIRSGEISGNLDEILKQLAEQMEREKSLRDNIKSATFYPIVVLCFALLVVIGMLVGVVPVFMKFFPPDMVLPLPTRIIVGISNSVRHYWYLYIIVTIAIVYGVRYYLQTPSGSRSWDQVRFKLPAFGPLLYRTVMARFTRVMSTLLAGGIPALQALETAGPASGSIIVAEAVEDTCEKIQEGKNIAGPLGESGVFAPMVVQMVAVGEESGNLPDMLSRVSGFYEEEVATMAKGLTSIIEPLLIIIVGCVVGFMVIAMYLPIFLVVTTVGG
jgi:type IV pilus assembly protein PilC